MAMPNTLTVAEIRKRILQNLGSDSLDVELTELQLDVAIRQALQTYEKFQPIMDWFFVDLPSSTQSVSVDFFDSPDKKKKMIRNVVDVRFASLNNIPSPSTSISRYMNVHIQANMRFPRLFLQYEWSDARHERFLNAQPDWFWDTEQGKLWLWNPGMPRKAMILGVKAMDVTDIKIRQETDFEKLATAKAKYILARVQSSLGNVPGAGGPIESDGAQLRTEAKEEENEVLAMLKRSLKSVPACKYIG